VGELVARIGTVASVLIIQIRLYT